MSFHSDYWHTRITFPTRILFQYSIFKCSRLILLIIWQSIHPDIYQKYTIKITFFKSPYFVINRTRTPFLNVPFQFDTLVVFHSRIFNGLINLWPNSKHILECLLCEACPNFPFSNFDVTQNWNNDFLLIYLKVKFPDKRPTYYPLLFKNCKYWLFRHNYKINMTLRTEGRANGFSLTE